MPRLKYRRLYDSTKVGVRFDAKRAYRLGDETPTGAYVYDDGPEDEHPGRIEMAVNVALATGRPLLLRGLPGTGKSSLAKDVADRLKWRYYEIVVSSRTQARDLLWTFDAVKRLSDAQVVGAVTRGGGKATLARDAAYITPGVLWWAFQLDSAKRRGLSEADLAAADIPEVEDPSGAGGKGRAVVLIDEIDKADPDVPNDLLVPLGAFRFLVDRTEVKAKQPPLVVITTNEERDLPRAFLRRCVTHRLKPPKDPRLWRIARSHFPDDPDDATLKKVLEHYRKVQARQHGEGIQEASIAEFLDAVAACRSLDVDPSKTELWGHVEALTLDKAARDGTTSPP
jgi:MoxR-like ATPase